MDATDAKIEWDSVSHGKSASPAASWSEIGLIKRQKRDRLIPKSWRIDTSSYAERNNVLDVPPTCGILTEKEIDITSNFDAVDIVENIRESVFSAEEVTVAFCKRAAIAQQLVSRDILS
jgi:amidase